MVYHWPDFMPGKNKEHYSIIRSWMWCTIGQILRPVFHDKYQLEDQERKKNKNKRLYSILYFSIVWLHGIKIGKLSCSPLLEGYGPLSLQLEAAQFGGALGLVAHDVSYRSCTTILVLYMAGCEDWTAVED